MKVFFKWLVFVLCAALIAEMTCFRFVRAQEAEPSPTRADLLLSQWESASWARAADEVPDAMPEGGEEDSPPSALEPEPEPEPLPTPPDAPAYVPEPVPDDPESGEAGMDAPEDGGAEASDPETQDPPEGDPEGNAPEGDAPEAAEPEDTDPEDTDAEGDGPEGEPEAPPQERSSVPGTVALTESAVALEAHDSVVALLPIALVYQREDMRLASDEDEAGMVLAYAPDRPALAFAQALAAQVEGMQVALASPGERPADEGALPIAQAESAYLVQQGVNAGHAVLRDVALAQDTPSGAYTLWLRVTWTEADEHAEPQAREALLPLAVQLTVHDAQAAPGQAVVSYGAADASDAPEEGVTLYIPIAYHKQGIFYAVEGDAGEQEGVPPTPLQPPGEEPGGTLTDVLQALYVTLEAEQAPDFPFVLTDAVGVHVALDAPGGAMLAGLTLKEDARDGVYPVRLSVEALEQGAQAPVTSTHTVHIILTGARAADALSEPDYMPLGTQFHGDALGTHRTAVVFTLMELDAALRDGYTYLYIGWATQETTAEGGVYAYRQELSMPGNQLLNDGELTLSERYLMEGVGGGTQIVLDGQNPLDGGAMATVRAQTEDAQIVAACNLWVRNVRTETPHATGDAYADDTALFQNENVGAQTYHFENVRHRGGTLGSMAGDANNGTIIAERVSMEVSANAEAFRSNHMVFRGESALTGLENDDRYRAMVVLGGYSETRTFMVETGARVRVVTSRCLVYDEASAAMVDIDGELDILLVPAESLISTETGMGGFHYAQQSTRRITITGRLAIDKQNQDAAKTAMLYTSALRVDGGELVLRKNGTPQTPMLHTFGMIAIVNGGKISVTKLSAGAGEQGATGEVVRVDGLLDIVDGEMHVSVPPPGNALYAIYCTGMQVTAGRVVVDVNQAQSGVWLSERLLIGEGVEMSVRIRERLGTGGAGIYLAEICSPPRLVVQAGASLAVHVPDMPALHITTIGGENQPIPYVGFMEAQRVTLASDETPIRVATLAGDDAAAVAGVGIKANVINRWTGDAEHPDFIWHFANMAAYEVLLSLRGHQGVTEVLSVSSAFSPSDGMPQEASQPLTPENIPMGTATKRLTFGSHALEAETALARKRTVTGTTLPGARVEALDAGGGQTLGSAMLRKAGPTKADAAGAFRLRTPDATWPSLQSTPYVRSEKDGLWCYAQVPVADRPQLPLMLYHVPDLDFGTHEVALFRTSLSREMDVDIDGLPAPWHIALQDNRADEGGTWTLLASIDQPLTAQRGEALYALPDALRIADALNPADGALRGRALVPGGGALPVLSGATGDRGENNLIRSDAYWSEEEGILLCLEALEGEPGLAYSTVVTWTLMGDPPIH